MFRKKDKDDIIHGGIHKISTLDIIKRYLDSKLPKEKRSIIDPNMSILPDGIEINHIAIVLDGKVEEVIRAQNKLAALLLSDPDFIEFDPKKDYPVIGKTKVIDGLFFTDPADQQGHDHNGHSH